MTGSAEIAIEIHVVAEGRASSTAMRLATYR